MGLDPMKEINEHGRVVDPNCINCLQCVARCPKDAVDFVVNPKRVPDRHNYR
jgi:NAD-dependent dihydropyrimidine dehydrogenase PreA subunit